MAKFNNPQNFLKKEEISRAISKIANDDYEMEKLNENSFMFSMSTMSPSKNVPAVKILSEQTNSPRGLTLADYLFHNPRNFVSTIILSLVWMSISIIYFGMTIGNTKTLLKK